MKGRDQLILSLFDGFATRLHIPVYQRKYEWKSDNCDQLYSDLLRMAEHSEEHHFFGSVVSAAIPDASYQERAIVDGQQRLTTVSLFLLAIAKLVREGQIKSGRDNILDIIRRDWIGDELDSKGTRLRKLIHGEDDRETYERICEVSFASDGNYTGPKPNPASNLTVNFNRFCTSISDTSLTAAAWTDAVSRLVVIHVQLDREDDPQLVFESLNSTGLALSEGDKIRNYILMGLQPRQQELLYRDYWKRIEQATNNGVSAFVRDYLSVQTGKIPPQSKVYTAFKIFREDSKSGIADAEELLKDMLARAKCYSILLGGQSGNRELDNCIDRLNRLETSVSRPFFLEVLKMRNQGRISEDDTVSVFRDTETYLFRRTICELPTNALNKIFVGLHREILRYNGSDDNYLAKFRYSLLSKKTSGAFPDDTMFREMFSTRNVYLMTPKNRTYILERLENYGTAEIHDVYKALDEGTYSIEHVMPQTLTPAWSEELGENFAEIHETWLHRIANLTLTAYNSRYGNLPFSEKKTMDKVGFDSSGVRMNTWFHDLDKWSLSEIKARSAHLSELALKIWALPKTNFSPLTADKESFSLAEEENLTGRKISAYVFAGIEHKTGNWIEMFNDVISSLASSDQSLLPSIADNPTHPLSLYFSVDADHLREPREIIPGIFVEQNTSTGTKISILRRLFTEFGQDPDYLSFVLKEDDFEKETEQGIARYELRRRFWKSALPRIKEVNEATKLFKNWKPTKGNWIASPLVKRGFAIVCIANFHETRIQLEIRSSPSVDRKAAFDKLLLHKNEINDAIGKELVWKRNDDVKTSKISLARNDIGIAAEEDWPRVAEFLSRWSHRFADVFTPYIHSESPS